MDSKSLLKVFFLYLVILFINCNELTKSEEIKQCKQGCSLSTLAIYLALSDTSGCVSNVSSSSSANESIQRSCEASRRNSAGTYSIRYNTDCEQKCSEK